MCKETTENPKYAKLSKELYKTMMKVGMYAKGSKMQLKLIERCKTLTILMDLIEEEVIK